jgi:hypothetical protein
MPEAATVTEMPDPAALNCGEPRAGRHGEAPRAETAGPEAVHAGEAAAAKTSTSEATPVESSTSETAAVESTAAETAVTSSTATTTRKRKGRGKRADRRHSSERYDTFSEHRSTPRNYSLHGRYNSACGVYIRCLPSHSRNEISILQ